MATGSRRHAPPSHASTELYFRVTGHKIFFVNKDFFDRKAFYIKAV